MDSWLNIFLNSCQDPVSNWALTSKKISISPQRGCVGEERISLILAMHAANNRMRLKIQTPILESNIAISGVAGVVLYDFASRYKNKLPIIKDDIFQQRISGDNHP